MAVETVRIQGLEGVLKTLKELPPEVVSKRGGPVRFALRRAAKVIQNEAKANIDKIVIAPNDEGIPTQSTGLLKKNVVVTLSKFKGGIKGEKFVVRVRKKKYPDAKGKGVHTKKVGALLEYGTVKRAPKPWMRPAFEVKKNEALVEFSTQINKKIAQVIKKLEAKNGAK